MAYREPHPDEWCQEIEYGLEYRRRFGREDMWGEIEEMYYNSHPSMANDGPNILLSQGDAMLSTLIVPAPYVKVAAESPECVDAVPMVEATDNMLFQQMRLSEVVETSTLHSYLFGKGIIKCGYDSEWGYDPSLDLGGSLKLGLTLTQLNKQGTRQLEYNSTVQPGMPWARSCMPHDIVVPWGVKDIQDTPWIAHRVVRHIDDLRADAKYENTRSLSPQLSIRDFVESYRTITKAYKRMSTQEAEYIEFYEIHDRRTGKIFCVTWDHDKFLRNDASALQLNNQLPFVAVSFTPRTRAFWTTPDAAYLYHSQCEVSDIARQKTKQRRTSVVKFLANKDAITEEEVQKILSPDVGAVAFVESGHRLNEAITKFENTPTNYLDIQEESIRANAREQIGFSRNQVGEYQGGRKTATEAGIVDRSSQLRMSRRGLLIKRVYEDIFSIVNPIIFKNWTLSRWIKVIGQEQAQEFIKVNGPQMDGQYSYKIEFVDEKEVDQRKMQALQLYGMLAQDPSVDPIELRKFLVSQVNDPSFGKLFNANIRIQLQQQEMLAQQQALANGSAKPQAQNGKGNAGALSQLQLSNGSSRVQTS